jgi:HlyD family secretion protein
MQREPIMTSAQKSKIQNMLQAAALSALLVGAGAGLASCGAAGADTSDKQKSEQAAASSPYAAIAAGKVDVEGGLVDIAARTAGIVMSVSVEEGAEVHKDEVLAQLDDEQATLQRNQASATLQQAQAQLISYQTALEAAQRNEARTEQLNAQNFVSPQAVENARDAVRSAQSQVDVQTANIAAARAALAEANYAVEQSIVRAPADGRIVRRYANPGMGASTLNVTPMFQLQPHAARIVRAELEERSLPLVHAGMRVEIVPEGDQSKSYPGTVLRIAQVFGARKLQTDDPSQQTDERVVEVVADAQQAQVLVGQRVLVKFIKDGANPQQAAAHTQPAAQGR